MTQKMREAIRKRKMADAITFFAKGRIPEGEIKRLVDSTYDKIDFNSWSAQHHGVEWYAVHAAEDYLGI